MPNCNVLFMNRRAVLITICQVSYELANQKKIRLFFSMKRVNTDHGSFGHRSPYKLVIQNFSSLSSSTMSSNGASNDNCITWKQPVRHRQEGLQCDGCQNLNHRTCNTGLLDDLVNYVETTWINGTYPLECWSVYGQPIRTNND